MLCLNIRSTYPRIGLHTQLGQLDNQMRPAQLHTDYQAPRANVHATLVKVDIDQYPSRHAYGSSTMGDFAAANEQQGLADVQEGVSERTQGAWDNVENGAKPGGQSRPIACIKNQIQQKIAQQRYLVAAAIPDPVFTVTPSIVQGDIDTGKDEVTAETYAFAEGTFTPGQVQVYLEQAGSVRMWTTEGQYDIYA